jgi:peroxiredoxin
MKQSSTSISQFFILHSSLEYGDVMEDSIPAVGQEAPDFTLPATIGEQVTLSQYRGQKHAVLAFYVLDWTNT